MHVAKQLALQFARAFKELLRLVKPAVRLDKGRNVIQAGRRQDVLAAIDLLGQRQALLSRLKGLLILRRTREQLTNPRA